VSSLQKGMTSEEVKEILGEPLEVTSLDSSQVRWRYYAVHRQDEEVIFLGRTQVEKCLGCAK
jgi:outer membrane protein assembly factor BamE (lipoprotein component of BamABCDE complex)